MPWVPEGPSVIAQHKVLGKCVFFICVLEGHLNDHAMSWDIIKLRINIEFQVVSSWGAFIV